MLSEMLSKAKVTCSEMILILSTNLFCCIPISYGVNSFMPIKLDYNTSHRM